MTKIEEIIKKYKLQPHPEGGYYREVYRSEQPVRSSLTKTKRNSVTHIYFLLPKGEVSRFHKVLHDEIWNFYEGFPLKLIEFNGEKIDQNILGQDNYVRVITGGIYQAAESTGDYTLVGCTVAPGFDFKDFSFLDSEPEKINKLNQSYKEFRRFV